MTLGRNYGGALERFLGSCDCFKPELCAHAEFAALKRIAACAALQDAASIRWAQSMNDPKSKDDNDRHDDWMQACNDVELAAEHYEGRA